MLILMSMALQKALLRNVRLALLKGNRMMNGFKLCGTVVTSVTDGGTVTASQLSFKPWLISPVLMRQLSFYALPAQLKKFV